MNALANLVAMFGFGESLAHTQQAAMDREWQLTASNNRPMSHSARAAQSALQEQNALLPANIRFEASSRNAAALTRRVA